MEEFMLNDDVFEQILDFNHKDLTEEQNLLIDKLVLNEELKLRYKYNGLCKESISVCQGLRPKSNYKIPQLILNIIKQCWDADPLKRPKANGLFNLLRGYQGDYEIKKQIEEADKINEKLTSSSLLYTGPTLSYTTNPQAVYTSRLLDFKNLPEPKNTIDNKGDDNSFGEYSGN
ncbi:uncharacterized protein OCT59_002196 [Rhizophagus irregularis]|uniref:uncharacterized protein n=1 Tax=Rhizophagus irregularis TaxID=588596 RepID=UPI003329438C|nr:hypothetical protein OCT59_002196 [Rhizophagus irregularis]